MSSSASITDSENHVPEFHFESKKTTEKIGLWLEMPDDGEGNQFSYYNIE